MGSLTQLKDADTEDDNRDRQIPQDYLTILQDTARLSELENYNIFGSGRVMGFDVICASARVAFGAKFCAVAIVDHAECHILGLSGTLRRAGEALSEPAIATVCQVSGSEYLLQDEQDWCTQADTTQDPAASTRLIGIPIRSQSAATLGALILGIEPNHDFEPKHHALALSYVNICLQSLEMQRTRSQYEQRARISRRQAEKLKEQQQVLTRNDRLFGKVSRMARIGGWELDCTTGETSWSGETRTLFGCHAEAELQPRQLLRRLTRHDVRALRQRLRDCQTAGVPFELDFNATTFSGENRWFCVTGEVEYKGDDAAKIYGTIQDVTNQKQREDEIHHVATHDELTGLPNRKLFNTEVARLLKESRRGNECLALMLIDADHFKLVNDVHGHEMGDHVLREFAGHLETCFREQDLVARLGGDEFAAILPGADDPEMLAKICDRLQSRLAKGIRHDGGDVLVTASIGYAIFPEHGTDAPELLRRADMALYHSKENGRARHSRYDASMCRQRGQKQRIVEQVLLAAQSGDILPHYQPIVDGFTGCIASLEALVRWRRSDGRLLPPGAFSEAFDDKAALACIGEVMIDQVIDQVAEWARLGVSTGPVAINMSTAELQEHMFAQRLLERIGRAGLRPSCLTIEVTEGIFLARGNSLVKDNLETLWKAGLRIALDDFGTGFASLTHLKDYPVDIVKIDRSFVAQVTDNNESLGIIKSIISLGRNLDIRIVAEGVETEQQANLLRHLGCDYLQGYHFSKPVPPELIPQVQSQLETCLLEPVRAIRQVAPTLELVDD